MVERLVRNDSLINTLTRSVALCRVKSSEWGLSHVIRNALKNCRRCTKSETAAGTVENRAGSLLTYESLFLSRETCLDGSSALWSVSDAIATARRGDRKQKVGESIKIAG